MKKEKKQKPEPADQFLEGIHQGRLDGRTRQAKAVISFKAALEVEPVEVMKSMLRDTVALNTMVERELIRFVVDNKDNLLTEDGRLPEALGKDLLAMQRATLLAMNRLYQLEVCDSLKDKAKPEIKDVSTLVLECQDATN
ncbi:hypothetical protein [Desulfonatronum thioautotrophicum]|uniref:hypothetical protein n=1 Tax=Desulfonatronum thioautotrophicum TaxID=617001 RepID=UPI0005EAF9D8|nr:hypothetical protein [Desulfonatronum thioautotrophicum]